MRDGLCHVVDDDLSLLLGSPVAVLWVAGLQPEGRHSGEIPTLYSLRSVSFPSLLYPFVSFPSLLYPFCVLSFITLPLYVTSSP